MIKKAVAVLIILSLVIAAIIYTRAMNYLQQPLQLPQQEVIYTVANGSSLNRVLVELQAQQILHKPFWLKLYARLKERTVIKAGEYRLEQGITPLGILNALNRGDVIQYQVTLVEGWTFRQALQVLHSQEKLDKQLLELPDDVILQRLGIEEVHPEGLFFPDTYQYHAGVSDVAILKRAYQAMQQILDEEWQQRAENLPYNNAYEALIMASIVEKETGAPEEREEIAGVFVRRLQKKMRLQTDPTVIYGIGDAYTGNITRKHLSEPTPYNTYVIKGLPPTPIALPGRAAIHATLHPAPGSTLYFVAMGDGYHYFSETLEEHTKAVRKYQRTQRRKDYRSSPPASSNAATKSSNSTGSSNGNEG